MPDPATPIHDQFFNNTATIKSESKRGLQDAQKQAL
jgi:hypothetical protein